MALTLDEKKRHRKEYNKKYNEENYAWRKVHGICTRCGRERAAPNRFNCSECLYKASERARKELENITEEERRIKNANRRETRHRKIESGICALCNKPIYTRSKSLCYEHYIYMLNYDRERRAKKRRERPEMVRIYTPPKARAQSQNHPWRKLDSRIFRKKRRIRAMQNRDCSTCMHDLGGGRDHCRINLTFECEAGGGYEAWEPYNDGVAAHEDEVDGQERPRVTLEDMMQHDEWK